MRNRYTNVVVIVLLAVVVTAALTMILGQLVDFTSAPTISVAPAPVAPQAAAVDQPRAPAVVYNPPPLENAPADLKDAVMLGASVMTDTQKVAASYVGNNLACSNCHFSGGVSQGGQNGGLSLVGVAAKYPQYRKRENYSVDLVTRVNDCFQRSENGKAMPADAKEMQALLAYFHWISKDIPIYAEVPWSTLEKIKSDHKPDAAAGKAVYSQKCSACHGADGNGSTIAPPVWGAKSYNDGAGMAKPETLAAFARLNMPRGNANLTVEQALDVAQFIDSQPRSQFATHS